MNRQVVVWTQANEIGSPFSFDLSPLNLYPSFFFFFSVVNSSRVIISNAKKGHASQ